MEIVENKTWWTKKNYKKYLKVLINEGVNGLKKLDRCPVVPEVEEAFWFYGVEIDYVAGVGFVFNDKTRVVIDNVSYWVVYERTFYFNKIVDRTYLATDGLKQELGEQFGLVKFRRLSCGCFDVEDWAKSILKDCEEKEKNNEEC